MSKTLLAEIDDVLTVVASPDWPQKSPAEKAIALAPELAEAVARFAQGLDPANRADRVPEFVEAAEAIFDRYIEPIDLPAVGPAAELAVDMLLRRSIRPVVEAIFAKLSG